jgi:hypothetical protein
MRKDALPKGLFLALLPMVVVPVVAAAAPSPSPSLSPSASTAVYVENRYQPSALAIKPHGYYSHVSIHNLKWTNWGQATTSAQGTFTFQFCVHESCSVSPFYAEPVVVSLTGIARCRARLFYTVLTFNVEGALPDPSFKTYRRSLGACPRRSSGGRSGHR